MCTSADRWAQMLGDPCDRAGNWVVLPENAWGAVMAYAAGPGRARPHDLPRHRRSVEVSTTTDGVTRTHSEPMSEDDLAAIAQFIDSILAEVGIPPSPCTWWEIDLPAEMTQVDVDEALGRALGGVDPLLEGAARTSREAEAVVAAVRGWCDLAPQ